MPWVKKIKYQKMEDLHACKLPNVSWRTRKVAPGSFWKCKKCGKSWEVISVKKYDSTGNYEMTWKSGNTTVIQHEPYDI